MVNSIYIYLCFTFFVCSCSILDDKLSLNQIEKKDVDLKLEGYYYHKYAIGNGFRYKIYFFYDNGTLLYGSSPLESELSNTEKKYISGEFYEMAIKHKYYWGVYRVDSNVIQFERWTPSDKPYKAIIDSGYIINDSSFTITKSFRLKNGKKKYHKEINETYYFKRINPKPEFKNSYIK